MSVGRALNDLSTHAVTFLHLVGATARTARRHKQLLLFPALSVVTTASLFLALVVLAPILVVDAGGDVSPIGLILPIVGFTLLFICLQYFSTTFFNVALTFAAFRALRDERTSPVAALAHALARVKAIVTYSAAAIAIGVVVAPLALIPRSRTFLSRLLPSLGVAWSVVPLLAIPVLVRERRGGAAAMRRAAALFTERWGETTLAAIGLRALWLPIAAASLFVFQHRPSSSSGNGELMWFAVILVLSATPMVVDSFARSMYGAALYVFAVEGVVPTTFDTAELSTVWRVGKLPEGGAQPAGSAGDEGARRAPWWVPAAALATIVFALVALAGWTPEAFRSVSKVRRLVSGSGPGLAINGQNFPEHLRMVWSRELPVPVPISGLAVRPDARIVVGTFPTIFVLDHSGNVAQQFSNGRWGGDGCQYGCGADGALMASANLPGTTGTSFIISGRPSQAVIAYDSTGARRWAWHTTEAGEGPNDLAAISIPGDGDLVAIRRSGFGGLCLLDAHGVERWCNKTIGAEDVDFVTTFDCNGDGQDEIVSLSPHSHPYFGSKLGCYSIEGKLVADLDVPLAPLRLRAVDVRGNGRKDLIAWHHDGLTGPMVLAAWTPDGHVLGELRLQTKSNYTAANITAVRLRAGQASDIAVALADGWVVGTSLDGKRWGHRFAGEEGLGVGIAAVDLDGGGAQELVIASGKTVTAWAWNACALQVVAKPASPARGCPSTRTTATSQTTSQSSVDRSPGSS